MEPDTVSTSDIKNLFSELIAAQKAHTEEVKKNNAGITSIRDLLSKTNDPEKLHPNAEVDAKLKRLNEAINSAEDKLKTIDLKKKADQMYGTVEGLANEIMPAHPLSADKVSSFQIAKSIIEDPHKEEYKEAFLNFVKFGANSVKGEQALNDKVQSILSNGTAKDDSYIKKSLTTIVGEDGGYLAPPEFDLNIQKVLFETSPLRQVATVRQLARKEYEFPIRTTLPKAFWGNSEISKKDQTDTQKYGMGKIPCEELQALPELSLNQIEDSAINIEAQLRMDLEEAFMLAENEAFIKGNGVEQPLGLVYYAGKSGSSYDLQKPLKIERMDKPFADVDADTLLDLEAKLLSPYKSSATWAMSRSTKNQVRQFKTTTGQYLFSMGHGWGSFQGVPKIRDGKNGMINGYPILECDDLDDGFTVANKYPIFFGNYKKYYILDRIGMTVIRDNVTKKGFVILYFRKRLGAGLVMGQALKALKTT